MRHDDSIKALKVKSRRSLAAAEALIDRGDFDFAASRIYYAMFYMAEALLIAKDKSFSSHSAVISAIHKEFVATGQMPRRVHAALHKAFGLRQKGDYLSDLSVTEDTARDILESARDFMRTAEELL